MAAALPISTRYLQKLFAEQGTGVAATGGGVFETVDSATARPIGTAADARQADVDSAVAAARAAFEPWRRLSPAARARILWRVGDLIDEHTDEPAALETRDQGSRSASRGTCRSPRPPSTSATTRAGAPRSRARPRRCRSRTSSSTPAASRSACARSSRRGTSR
ncbi:aldehyde dehydrogenase family protein [Amycolatopsis methanolica]|uniref:aldehyde dehydrogenase family protein n=1 Tax=Amycolatopsis methanolica TaxID=1814 RepID=UPI002B3FFF22|nr:aldehyde dehydrogenase family protein [Amycolatopsis methanolica]